MTRNLKQSINYWKKWHIIFTLDEISKMFNINWEVVSLVDAF